MTCFSGRTVRSSDKVLSSTAIYAVDATLHSKHDWASDLWGKLQFLSELESDIWDIFNWGKKEFVNFNTGKTQRFSFDLLNRFGVIDIKKDRC